MQSEAEKTTAQNYARPDKSSNNRSGQRARKLQLSDVDWYDSSTSKLHPNPNIHSRSVSSPPNKENSPTGPSNRSSPSPTPSFAATQRGKSGKLTRKAILQSHEQNRKSTSPSAESEKGKDIRRDEKK